MNWIMEGHMRRKRTLYLLALSFALGATSNLLADGPTFTQIDFPGAAYTYVNGIMRRHLLDKEPVSKLCGNMLIILSRARKQAVAVFAA